MLWSCLRSPYKSDMKNLDLHFLPRKFFTGVLERMNYEVLTQWITVVIIMLEQHRKSF